MATRLPAIAILLTFLTACSCSPSYVDYQKNRLYTDIYSPTVLVRCGDTSYGSGTVIQSRNGTTYVLTAAHVVRFAYSDPYTYFLTITDWAGSSKEVYEASLVAYDQSRDLAVLKAEYCADAVATVSLEKATLFQECRVAGIGMPMIPLCTSGEVQGFGDGGKCIYSDAPIYWGYSGGGLYVWEGGMWKLAGVPVQIGMIKGTPVYVLTIHSSLFESLEWLRGIAGLDL